MHYHTRTYPDKSCHRIAEVNSAEVVPSFEDAQAKCRAEGARLYQPRNQDAYDLLRDILDEQMSNPVPYENSGSKYIAIGLKVDYSQGWPQLQGRYLVLSWDFMTLT